MTISFAAFEHEFRRQTGNTSHAAAVEAFNEARFAEFEAGFRRSGNLSHAAARAAFARGTVAPPARPLDATPNQVIQNPQISQKLARALDVKSPAPPSLEPTVQPVVLVSDLTDPIISDTDYERDAIGFDNKGAVVARFNELQLFNPLGSSVLIIIDACIVSSDTAQEVQIRAQDSLFAAQTLNRGFRNRSLAGEPAAQQSGVDSAAVAGDLVAGARAIANQSVSIPLGISCPPGTGIKVSCTVANTTLAVTWFWTEIALAS